MRLSFRIRYRKSSKSDGVEFEQQGQEALQKNTVRFMASLWNCWTRLSVLGDENDALAEYQEILSWLQRLRFRYYSADRGPVLIGDNENHV